MNIKNIYWVFLFLLLSFSFASCGGDDDNESLSGGGITDLSRNREAVDLGLSVKWANMNIGANSETDYGTYFAWGETTGYTVIGATNVGASGNIKTEFSWATYKWCEGTSDQLTKYCDDSNYGYNDFTDDKTELDLEDDAAYVNWGSDWHMPSIEQIQELIDKCTWTRTTLNGVKGREVTGPNGNSIFLPAADYRDSDIYDDGSCGFYWSRSLHSSDYPYPLCAYGLGFDWSGADWFYGDYRRCGQSVRAVRR